jgi:hypothetical protein
MNLLSSFSITIIVIVGGCVAFLLLLLLLLLFVFFHSRTQKAKIVVSGLFACFRFSFVSTGLVLLFSFVD